MATSKGEKRGMEFFDVSNLDFALLKHFPANA